MNPTKNKKIPLSAISAMFICIMPLYKHINAQEKGSLVSSSFVKSNANQTECKSRGIEPFRNEDYAIATTGLRV